MKLLTGYATDYRPERRKTTVTNVQIQLKTPNDTLDAMRNSNKHLNGILIVAFALVALNVPGSAYSASQALIDKASAKSLAGSYAGNDKPQRPGQADFTLGLGLVPIFALAALLAPQPAPIDVGISSRGKFAFDWNGEHDDDTPGATVTKIELHYIPVPPIVVAGAGTGDGHVTIMLDLEATVGENIIPMRTALAGVPAGTYDFSVRLFGVGGNPSTYSDPVLSIRVRVKNPAPPTSVRVVGG